MTAAADRDFQAEELEPFAERFEAYCLQHPDHPAICVDGESWTYGELRLAAHALAANLLRLVPTAERPVAILLQRGPAFMAAIIGAVLARRSVVAIDADYPLERNLQVLEDADPALVIVSEADRNRLEGGPPQVAVQELLRPSATAFKPLPGPADELAFLIYTSGSTGKPKAAMVTQGALAQIGHVQTRCIGVRGSDRHAMLHSATTTGGLRTMFGALSAGATLLPYELGKLGVRPLADWLERNRITVVHTTATVIRHLVREVDGRCRMSSVRLMIFGAERVFWDDIRLARSIFSDELVIWTGLGASETTTLSGWQIPSSYPLADGLVPLGKEVDGVLLRLVDENGHDVQDGEIGEIVARGRYISLGYWRRPELTEKAFSNTSTGDRIYRTGDLARRLPNGMFLHSGRRDFVVKINGVRVDMGEVEAAIARDPDIAECAVVCESVTPTENRLHAFVEAARGARLSDERLRSIAASALLPAMRPTYYWQVDNWPRTMNGKLNRRALLGWTDRRAVATETQSPEDDVVLDDETAIAAAWEKVMPGRSPGRHEDFFAAGGTSLMAIELTREIRAKLNRPVPAELIFRAPTVAGLARALQVPDNSGRDSVVTLQASGDAPPLYCICGIQLYAELAKQLAPDVPVHGVFLALEEALGDASTNTDELTVEAMAASYVAAIRGHRPNGPYAILGISFGGVLAYEVAQQLSDAGQEVRVLALLDCTRPGGSIVPWYGWPAAALRRLFLRKLPTLAPASAPGLVGDKLEVVVGPGRLAAYRKMRAKYTPRNWLGRTLLFRAEHTFRFLHFGQVKGYGWERVASDLDTVDIPGDHLGILRSAGAVEIAKVLRSRVDPQPP